MSQAAQFDADVAAVEPELPTTFKFNGKEFTGSRTPIMDRQAMEDAGFEQSFDFQILVRASQFDRKPPCVRDQIEMANEVGQTVNYFIVSAQPSQDGVIITYSLSQVT